MNRTVLTNLMFLVAVLITSTQALAITVEELADICEAMEKNIQDIYIEFECVYGSPPADFKDKIGNSFFIMDGAEKITWATKRPFGQFSISTQVSKLVNQNGAPHSEIIKTSYNGKITKRLQSTNDYLEGLVTRRDGMVHDILHTPAVLSVLRFSFSEAANRKTLSELLRGKERAILYDEILEINGFKAIKVDILTQKTKRPWGSVYFSVDHGYTPIRYDDWNGDDLVARFNVKSLEKISGGLWFPKNGYREGPSGEKQTIYTTSKVSLNQGLSNEFFDFEFPAGTKIYDEILGLIYTYRPSEDEFLAWLGDEEPVIIHRVQEVEGIPVEIDHKAGHESTKNDADKSSNPVTMQGTGILQQQTSSQENHVTALIYGGMLFITVILILFGIHRYLSNRSTC